MKLRCSADEELDWKGDGVPPLPGTVTVKSEPSLSKKDYVRISVAMVAIGIPVLILWFAWANPHMNKVLKEGQRTYHTVIVGRPDK